MNFSIRQYWKVIAGCLVAVAGGLAIVIAWSRVSDRLEVADQVPLLMSGGIGGLALVLGGVWLLRSHETDVMVAHLRETTERLDRMQEDVARLTAIFDVAEVEIEQVSPAREAMAD